MKERLAAGKPESFRFENEGDFITGEIEDIFEITTDWGPRSVLTLLDEDGEAYNVAMLGGVLQGKMESLRPVVGMTIAVRYEGTKPSKTKGHADYKDYWVLLDEATRPVGAAATPAPVARREATPSAAVDEYEGEEPF